MPGHVCKEASRTPSIILLLLLLLLLLLWFVCLTVQSFQRRCSMSTVYRSWHVSFQQSTCLFLMKCCGKLLPLSVTHNSNKHCQSEQNIVMTVRKPSRKVAFISMTTAMYAEACSEIGSALVLRSADGSAYADLHLRIPLPAVLAEVYDVERWQI